MTAVGDADLIRVVLADANVLYSRVLRDYLLYAADQEIIAVAWSPAILAEAVEHLRLNVSRFDREAARRLVTALNRRLGSGEGRRVYGPVGWRSRTEPVVSPEVSDPDPVLVRQRW